MIEITPGKKLNIIDVENKFGLTETEDDQFFQGVVKTSSLLLATPATNTTTPDLRRYINFLADNTTHF